MSPPAGPVNAAGELHPVLLHHIVNSLEWRRLLPLQDAAVAPLLAGADALLVAPTAGGKTEAAVFPLLTRMAAEDWRGVSLAYICPLKALLGNLLPRFETYTAWLGRTAALWHSDVTAPARRRILRTRPDVLLTTPESLESMLVSVNVDHRVFFSGLRAVIVDEVHAFAGDDRGWHLLAVLERLGRVAGRPLQRIGLSATVGNPDELLRWLQGSGSGRRRAQVIAPGVPSSATATGPVVRAGPEVAAVPGVCANPTAAAEPTAMPGDSDGDVELDYVGSVSNAAKVIASLHNGEKRLVFCDSRRLVEEIGQALRARGVTTFLSHASLSADERRRSEDAFIHSRDCVIVATTTLELGVDVGDLDRVVQVNAPSTVAGFLQRMGRAGRRPGTSRNCLFLALTPGALLHTAALLVLWGRGWVEPVVPTPDPRHIAAQQLIALCLQENRVGEARWAEWWDGLAPFGRGTEPIARHLVEAGYLDVDDGMLFVGPEAERRYGHRHFSALTAVFTAAPQFAVYCGRDEIGRTDPALLTERVDGPRLLLLAGRSWRVTYTDWKRRRCYVEPADGGGKARWITPGMRGLSFPVTRAMREVLLGSDPPAALTDRAVSRLAAVRDDLLATAHPAGTVVARDNQDNRADLTWWTWAGLRANLTLAATLAGVTDPMQRPGDAFLRIRGDVTPREWKEATADAVERLCLPDVDDDALAGLKFSEALPDRLARATLAARLADFDGAAAVLREPVRFHNVHN